MIVICEDCGKKYRIDERKMTSDTAKLRCKACSHIITVRKADARPPGPPAAEPTPEPSPAAGPPPEAPEPQEPPRKPDPQPAVASGISKVRFGLFPKLILLMLFISLVPFCLFWFITFQEASGRIRSDTEQLMAQTTQGLVSQVDEWLDKNTLVLQAAARMPDIVSMNRLRQEPVLQAIQQEYPWMYLVFTVDIDGMNKARSDGKPLKDYSDRQYYKDIVEGKDITWQTLIGKTSKKPALVLAAPIYSGETLVGVMAAAMTVDDISKNVANWRKGSSGYAFLVDDQGKVVSHQIKSYVTEQKNLSAHPLIAAYRQQKSPVGMAFTDADGAESLGHVRGNKYGWALAVVQQDQEVYAGLREIQRMAFTLLGVTVVLVVLIAWFSARTVVRPIMRLTDVAERMSMGELDAEIDVRTKDEIGLLAQAVGRMQISLRLALERLRRTA